MSFFDHFSETKSTRLGDWISRKTAMQEFSFIQQHLFDKSAHILEIGPGKGILANEFLSQGYHNYTVVEPNNLMRAKFEHAGVSTKNYMLPEIHEDALSYDVIILVDVFEHLNGAKEAILFIKNAIEASSMEETISINISTSKNYYKVDIHNNAVVPKKIQNTFFDKYSTSSKEDGTGLGTYSAMLIAKIHGGIINFTSNKKKGTHLYISFPKHIV